MQYFLLKFTLIPNSALLLETVGLHVPAWYIREFSVFSVCSSSKNCPSALADNFVCMDIDVFGTKTVSFNHIL
jgi:hypothetical protein